MATISELLLKFLQSKGHHCAFINENRDVKWCKEDKCHGLHYSLNKKEFSKQNTFADFYILDKCKKDKVMKHLKEVGEFIESRGHTCVVLKNQLKWCQKYHCSGIKKITKDRN